MAARAHEEFTHCVMHLQGYLALVWISTNNGRGRTMLLLLTSAVALLLGIGIMPLSA
jgi:hypothetical protein